MSNFSLHNISHFIHLWRLGFLENSFELSALTKANYMEHSSLLYFTGGMAHATVLYCALRYDIAKFQVEALFPTQGHYSFQPTVRSKYKWRQGIIDRHCILSSCDSTRVSVLISTNNFNKRIWNILSIRELSLFIIIDDAIVYFWSFWNHAFYAFKFPLRVQEASNSGIVHMCLSIGLTMHTWLYVCICSFVSMCLYLVYVCICSMCVVWAHMYAYTCYHARAWIGHRKILAVLLYCFLPFSLDTGSFSKSSTVLAADKVLFLLLPFKCWSQRHGKFIFNFIYIGSGDLIRSSSLPSNRPRSLIYVPSPS